MHTQPSMKPDINMGLYFYKTIMKLYIMQDYYAIQSRIRPTIANLKNYYAVTLQLWVRFRPFSFPQDRFYIDDTINQIKQDFLLLEAKKFIGNPATKLIQILDTLDDISKQIHYIALHSGLLMPYTMKAGKSERISKAIADEI